MPPRPLSALLLATACQLPPTGSTNTSDTLAFTTLAPSTGSTSGADDTTGAAAPGSSTSDTVISSTSAASDSSNTAPPIFDLGTDADLGAQHPPGCQGKVDLLFVIARDGVLAPDPQNRLIAAFPPFMTALKDRFTDLDYHIMVVDGDAGWGLDTCNEECTPNGCEYVANYPCDQLDLVTWCDKALGAGTVFNAGGQAPNKPCDIAGGKRFLTRQQPDLEQAFACIARVGISGNAWLGDALMNAMTTQLSGPGGCNDKFLRKDALLLVTFIGGSDVQGTTIGSQGTPEQWKQAVLDAKHGDFSSVVMLAIGTSKPDCPWWGDRICALAGAFPFHHIADSRALDYEPAFAAVTDLVDQACIGFHPPP